MKSMVIGLICMGMFILSITPPTIEAQPGPGSGSVLDEPVDPEKMAIVDEMLRRKNENRVPSEAISHKLTYRLTDLDTRITAHAIAREQIKALFLDEWTGRVRDQLDDRQPPPGSDRIRALLSCIMRVDIAKEKWKGRTLLLEAKVNATPPILAEAVSLVLERQSLVREIVTVRELAVQAAKEIKLMQEEADRSGDRTSITERYSTAAHQLFAADAFEKACYLGLNGQPQKAIDAYTEAIEALPGMAVAYRNRGRLYLSYLKDRDRAIADFNIALRAYGDDAQAHMKSKEYEKCMEDINTALKLNAAYANGYYQRAACSIGLGKQDDARKDFIKAAQLGEERSRKILTARGIVW